MDRFFSSVDLLLKRSACVVKHPHVISPNLAHSGFPRSRLSLCRLVALCAGACGHQERERVPGVVRSLPCDGLREDSVLLGGIAPSVQDPPPAREAAGGVRITTVPLGRVAFCRLGVGYCPWFLVGCLLIPVALIGVLKLMRRPFSLLLGQLLLASIYGVFSLALLRRPTVVSLGNQENALYLRYRAAYRNASADSCG